MEHVLVLLDADGKPERAIGPFQFADSPAEWMKENIGSRPVEHVVLDLEPHGWDNGQDN